MELQHFSHEHPLILGEVNDDGEAIVCNVCWENISGSAFSCKNCLFFLHKFCAEFPEEMKHPIHAHSLTLQDSGSSRCCDVCNDDIRGFTYQCSPCGFDVDIRCSVRGQHFSSKHQLMILNEDEKNDVDERLSCDVCLQQITGSTAAYKCTNCSPSIYFHKLCAQLPAEMEHPMHPEHPLALVQVVADEFVCDGCDIDLKEFMYRCSTCDFNLDRRCALRARKVNHESHNHPLRLVPSSASFECHACGTKREGMSYMDRERESAIEVENIDEANLIHLPMADDSISAIDLFLKQIRMGDNKREVELNHFSHHHPLILFDAQGDNNLCYENQLLILNELNKDKICNACVRKISAPFYTCGLCDFFLHKWCAELPNELEHPCHPHQLILLKKPPEPRGLFFCTGCGCYCNGFAITCIEDICSNYFENYKLDVKCAFLPKAIIHKVHEHPLYLKKDCITAGCAACPRMISMFAFGCDICNFNLHYTCAVLPDTIKHRYDEHHPFTLIYAPIKDGPDEYICEFCEEEIDPNWWFYHCIDCDQSACAKCICTERKEVQNIKWGSTYNFDSHPHCLIYVPMTNKSFNCAYCHRHINSLSLVEQDIASKIGFKCEQCNIMLHAHCPHP
ncbi:hypothetical protein TEA_013541 [Camellia sinensis var. sinensis]|uniref:Phorbol-ester/DAG-type domain-containing protein n=1 Tax=Camellia sinensis var. sinensis TaxID=542762 RepID=A0A4V3WPP3_CAMSN|nr:hypothetical protein TEA_013541 [Camellia sinensis var. sinensis]